LGINKKDKEEEEGRKHQCGLKLTKERKYLPSFSGIVELTASPAERLALKEMNGTEYLRFSRNRSIIEIHRKGK
jgi:hypothetical protein